MLKKKKNRQSMKEYEFDDNGYTECPHCKGIGYRNPFDHVTLEKHVMYNAIDIAFEKKMEELEIEFKYKYDAEKVFYIATEYSNKHWNKHTQDGLDCTLCRRCEGSGLVSWVDLCVKRNDY